MKDITTYKDALDTAEERGIKKGVEQEKISIAKNLIDQGLGDEMISKSTGLSLNAIKKFRAKDTDKNI